MNGRDSEHLFSRWRKIAGGLFVFCALADFWPLHGPPFFRYTGSDPAVDVWNLGWPLVLVIYDSTSGLHIGPFVYAVIPAQVLVVGLATAVAVIRRRQARVD